MKYFGGCDVGSTYTKCVILDENGTMVANVTNRSKINPVASAEIALNDAVNFRNSKIKLFHTSTSFYQCNLFRKKHKIVLAIYTNKNQSYKSITRILMSLTKCQ